MFDCICSALFLFLFWGIFILRAKPDRKVLLRLLIAFLCGGIIQYPIGFAEIYAQYGLMQVLSLDALGNTSICAAIAGIFEEGIKLLIALLCIRGLTSGRKIDYILIFGAAGAGFEFFENLGYITITDGDIASILFRAVLIFHTTMLYIDAFGYLKYREGKKLSFILSILFTVILHAVFDLGSLAVGSTAIDPTLATNLMMTSFAIQFFVMILLIIAVVKISKEIKRGKKA